MPKLINAYGADNTLANAFSEFANSFNQNTPQKEVQRQAAIAARRENDSIPALAEAVIAEDPRLAAKFGILSGRDPKNTAGYGQYLATNKYGVESPQALTATMAVPGANFGNTVLGTREGEQTKYNIADMTAQRSLAHDQRKYDNTPSTVLIDGIPRLVPQSQALQERMQPVLNEGQVKGGILQQDAPGYTPQQRATVTGAYKAPSNVWSYRRPDGSLGNSVDGVTDNQTGQPVTGGLMKLEGANADGLTGNGKVDNDRLNNRVATEQFATGIDTLVAQLSKPDADQAGGWVGAGARLFNDIRSQTEAAVRLAGGETFAQAFDPKANPANASSVDSAMNMLLRNPTVVQKMQSLGIDNALLRSQLQDLAYMDAKAKDPGGRVSNEDIRRSMETIAGSVADPTTGIQVLQAAKQRAITNMEIRERNINSMYPKAANTPAASPAAPVAAPTVAPAQGAQPQAAPPAAAPRRRYNPATGGIE